MSSFYGGKQGRTYHIVARYNSVHEMIEQFQRGGAYTEANYGEYVLIDTVFNGNRRGDLQNGLLFRRGFNYLEQENPKPNREDFNDQFGNFQEEEYNEAWKTWVQAPGGGAIYVGQIVGPEGRTPELQIQDWEDFEAQLEESSGFGRHSTVSMNHPGLVKNGNQYEYNDQIDAGYVNILDENDNITGGYIAFDIPTPVFTVTAQSVDPYGTETLSKSNIESTLSSTYKIGSTYDNQGKWKYDGLIYEQPESKEHPFYHNFDIAIPKGIHGQQITEIKVETASTVQGSDFSHSIYEDITDGDQYFTYTIKNYDASAAGASTAHLGRWPYRVINEITAERDINKNRNQYEGGDDPIQGQIHILNNSYTDKDTLIAVCIKSGTPINFEDIENPQVGEKYPPNIIGSTSSQWLVTTIPTVAAANILRIDFKAGKDDTVNFRQIDYLYVDTVGKMFVVYSDQPTVSYYLTQINGIDSVDRNENEGSITIYYTNGKILTFKIKEVTDITFENSILNSQNITVHYKGVQEPGSTTSTSFGPFNSILDIKRVGDTLKILYSDPEMRKVKGTWTDPENPTWEDWRYPGSTYDSSKLKWHDLGALGSQYHVLGSFSFNDISITGSTATTGDIAYGLDKKYQDKAGWIITIPDYVPASGEQGSESYVPASTVQRIFAYNYKEASTAGYNTIKHLDPANTVTIKSNWYEIMSGGAGATPPQNYLVVSEDVNEKTSEDTIFQQRTSLAENGIWFVVTGGHDNG